MSPETERPEGVSKESEGFEPSRLFVFQRIFYEEESTVLKRESIKAGIQNPLNLACPIF